MSAHYLSIGPNINDDVACLCSNKHKFYIYALCQSMLQLQSV